MNDEVKAGGQWGVFSRPGFVPPPLDARAETRKPRDGKRLTTDHGRLTTDSVKA